MGTPHAGEAIIHCDDSSQRTPPTQACAHVRVFTKISYRRYALQVMSHWNFLATKVTAFNSGPLLLGHHARDDGIRPLAKPLDPFETHVPYDNISTNKKTSAIFSRRPGRRACRSSTSITMLRGATAVFIVLIVWTHPTPVAPCGRAVVIIIVVILFQHVPPLKYRRS